MTKISCEIMKKFLVGSFSVPAEAVVFSPKMVRAVGFDMGRL